MAACNADVKCTNVVAKWHGSTHDSAVFNVSVLQVHLETSKREGWLLGDRGYGPQPYLMTPLKPKIISSQAERKYQKSHMKTRSIFEPVVSGCQNKDSAL